MGDTFHKISLCRSITGCDRFSAASPSVADVFHEVEDRKCAFQGTAASVAERGAKFVPLVLEAWGRGGGWEGGGGYDVLFVLFGPFWIIQK